MYITFNNKENRHPLNGLFFQDNLGKPAPERQNRSGYNKARYDGVAAAAGSYTYHLHPAPNRQPRQHLITQYFAGCMLFLTTNQQCQSTEGNHVQQLGIERVQACTR